MIQSQGSPAHPRDSSPGRLDWPPKHRASGSASCALAKRRVEWLQVFQKATRELPKPKAAESAACAQARIPSPGLLDQQAARSKPLVSFPNPKQLDPPAACARLQSQRGWSPRLHVPRTKLMRDWLINCLIACQGPHLQRLPNTSLQSPQGPTSSLRQRQNAQQRGAAGLGDTAG